MQIGGKESITEKVRERAYAIWEREGRPHGRDREHWLMAEREVMVPVVVPSRPVKKAVNGSAATKAASVAKVVPKKRAAPAVAKPAPKTTRRKTTSKKK